MQEYFYGFCNNCIEISLYKQFRTILAEANQKLFNYKFKIYGKIIFLWLDWAQSCPTNKVVEAFMPSVEP